MNRSTRSLVLAATTAVLTVAGAVAVVATTDRTPAPPGGAGLWSLDAAETFGRAFAQFRSPTAATDLDVNSVDFVEAGVTIVTLVALPNPRTDALDEPTLIGIDAGSGTVRWQTRTGPLGGCSDAPLHGDIICQSGGLERNPSLLSIDTDTGELSRHPLPEDWYVLAVEVAGGRVLVAEGNPEDDDVEVHSGTLEDADADWTTRFDMGAAWEQLFDEEILTRGGDIGAITMGGSAAGFEVSSGWQVWESTSSCSARVHVSGSGRSLVTRTSCRDGQRPGTDVYDSHGRLAFTTEATGRGTPTLNMPADDATPILIDTSAYDPGTGEQIWSEPDLASANSVAIVGDSLLARTTDSELALDLGTGRQLWEKAPGPRPTTYDGSSAVSVTDDRVVATDPRTGAVVWELPFEDLGIDRDGGTVTATATDSGLIVFNGRSMALIRQNRP